MSDLHYIHYMGRLVGVCMRRCVQIPPGGATISQLPQLTFGVHIMHIFASFGTLFVVKTSLNFNCKQLWIVFALNKKLMCLETQ